MRSQSDSPNVSLRETSAPLRLYGDRTGIHESQYWFETACMEPFVEFIKPGSALVIYFAGDGDTGSIGSDLILKGPA